MSRLTIATPCMALALIATPVVAQDTPGTADPAVAELQSMVDRFQALEDVVLAEEQARRVERGMRIGVPTATFPVGSLTVVARTDQVEAVRTSLQAALPFYEGTVRGGAEHVLTDGEWVAQFYEGDLAPDLGVWGDGTELVDVQVGDGPQRMTVRAEELLGDRLRRGLPLTARDWAGGTPLMAPGFSAGFTWRLLRREAVSTGSIAVRSCLGGNAEACWSVLGFPRTDNTLTEWYSEDERRLIAMLRGQMLKRSRASFRRGDGSTDREMRSRLLGQVRDCQQRDMTACDDIVSDLSHRSPLPMIFRTSLLWHALETGGEGAYTRFAQAVEAGASIPEALGSAAHRSSDEVARTWAARIVATRTPVQHDLGFAGLSSVLWMLTLAGIGVHGAIRRTV